jgi:hypothetical protein
MESIPPQFSIEQQNVKFLKPFKGFLGIRASSFINAPWQCLLHTTTIERAFQTKYHDNKFCQQNCPVCMFQGMVNESTNSTKYYIKPPITSININGNYIKLEYDLKST